MIIIKLTNQQFAYLRSNLPQRYRSLLINQKVDKKKGMTLLYIDPASMDVIRDWVGSELQRVGFDRSYGLTDKGKILEQLVDLFYLKPESTN